MRCINTVPLKFLTLFHTVTGVPVAPFPARGSASGTCAGSCRKELSALAPLSVRVTREACLASMLFYYDIIVFFKSQAQNKVFFRKAKTRIFSLFNLLFNSSNYLKRIFYKFYEIFTYTLLKPYFELTQIGFYGINISI